MVTISTATAHCTSKHLSIWRIQDIKIIPLNTRGLNICIKCKRVYSVLLKQHPDALYLQETHTKVSTYNLFAKTWFDKLYQALESSKSRGVAICLSKRLHFLDQGVQTDPQGQFLFLKGKLGEKTRYFWLNICSQLKSIIILKRWSKWSSQIPRWKCTAWRWSELDKQLFAGLEKIQTGSSRKYFHQNKLSRLLVVINLVDNWRHQHKKERDYTYFSDQNSTYTRIDYILALHLGIWIFNIKYF